MQVLDIQNTNMFGNMLHGGGLAALRDGSLNTVGYTQSSVGYAGFSLPSPKRIGKVVLYSADNGFDGSGLTTNITLQLYGKVGAAPTSAFNGELLGTLSFVDQNRARSLELASLNTFTEFDHVWVVVSTGMWALLADVVLYEAPEPQPEPTPEPLTPGNHVFIKSCDIHTPLVKAGVELNHFRTRFYIDSPRVVLLDFHADVRHDGTGSDAGVAVGFSFWLSHRTSQSLSNLGIQSFTPIRNAVGGGNVSERNPQHYGNKTICTSMNLQAGWHEFTVVGNGHTDGTSTDGLLSVLAEGGMGLNCLRTVVLA